jgi:8-oxo-dGTP pyrophosphatase MutT (NUDIX family)
MKTLKTVSNKTLLDMGKYLVVENHSVELPDGRVIHDWPWIITPDYINVVAVTDDGKFPVFRQTKYSVEGTSLAPVGGYLDPGEDPLTAAKRELLEETGYEASEWTHLGSFPVDGNRGAGVANLYLAQGAHFVADIDSDDLEEQELLLLSRSEMEAALDAGEFKVLAWAANIALALRHLP